MKVLIFSDVHSNLEALKEVISREKYDRAIFLGDIVDYGPNPAETMDIVLDEADYIVQGNHDYAAANDEDCHCSPDMHDVSELTRTEITMKLLGKGDLRKLSELKTQETARIDGKNVLMVHASPNNPLFGYLFSTEAEMVWKKPDFKQYDYIMVGHTHFPMFYRGRIINPGSCGQPRDGDWMPMYSVLDTESGDLTFKRFRYDHEKMVGKLSSLLSEYPDQLEKLKRLYL